MVLRILREANGYSQQYVGSVLGIEQNTYSKLENGQIKLTADRIYKLAELYHVAPEVLISRELPIVNYNSGTFSKGNVSSLNFNESNERNTADIVSMKDKIIEEKEKQILYLKELLEEKKAEISFWKNFHLNEKNK